MSNLYSQVESFIEDYYEDEDHCDFIDKLEKKLQDRYKGKHIYIYDFDTENDTSRLDMFVEDILAYAKSNKIVDSCAVWEDESLITVIIAD